MTFRVGTIDVLHKPAIKFDSANANYSGFQPSTSVLQAGHQLTPESRAFEESVIYDRDVALEMRDGVKLRADIFRPDTTDKVPALVVWSPYGKTGTGKNKFGFHALYKILTSLSKDRAPWIKFHIVLEFQSLDCQAMRSGKARIQPSGASVDTLSSTSTPEVSLIPRVM